ncbi:MAG TPA: hypothetical protein PKL31_16650 [Fulvivirga sp.]|nr:hypothetical protein [Fulvivirga sp.]
MKYTLRFFFSFLLSLIAFNAIPQSQILDNNPASTKWEQIKTPGFKVIFPKGFEETANKVANTLETIREPETATMGKKSPKRISIVLQNNSALSNGFVTLAPRRSEFYTLPPQDYNFAGTNKWLDLLAVHEYRHIVQFQRSKAGFNKVFYYLFGENTQAGMAFAAAPKWFWEGDATLMETAITPSGRGRIPSFDRVFRANILEGKRINYHKQYLRSYKDFIPDHYKMGYYMVAHLRRRTGQPEIWNDISKSAFNTPFIPFTFSNAMKKHTGHFVVDNYNMMMDDLKKEWREQLEGLKLTEYQTITKRSNSTYTDYAFPQVLEDGSIVAFKSGLADMGQLVRVDANGNEIAKIVTGVMSNTGMLSATHYKVYWNENEFDPRWRAKTYSVIKSYDFATRKLKRVTSKTRYSGAAISPDGYKVATINNSIDNRVNLVIIDAFSGKEIKRFDNPENAELGMPRWSQDGRSIVVLKISDQGKSVVSIDVESGAIITLIDTSNENIGSPVLAGDHLFYNSPFNGIDNIYAKDLKSGKRYQVTSSKYGAYNASVNKDEIVYNEHTINGLSIVKIENNPANWKPLEEVEDRNVNYIEPIVEQEGLTELLDARTDTRYEVKKYSKLGHMVNIHSWGPFASTDLNTAQFGIFSRDVLSTTSVTLGYTYDINEGSGYASAGVSYQGWYPVIDLEYQIGDRQTTDYSWSEKTINAGLSIPLLLTKSKYHKNLTISNGIGVRQISDFKNKNSDTGRDFFGSGIINYQNGDPSDTVAVFGVTSSELDNGEMIFNDFEISYTNLIKQSTRDIASRWGQFFVFKQLNTVAGDFNGATTGIRGGLFFPGLFKNHSLNFRFGYQMKDTSPDVNIYSFRNVIFKPRGYSFPNEQTFGTIQANYALPLWYPDIALGPFLNIKRLKANLFFDYGKETTVNNYFFGEDIGNVNEGDFFNSRTVNSNYASYGIELTTDINIMRFAPELEVGIRVLNRNSNFWNTGGSSLEIIFGGINF